MMKSGLKTLACLVTSILFGALLWWMYAALSVSQNESPEAGVLVMLILMVATGISLTATVQCAIRFLDSWRALAKSSVQQSGYKEREPTP